MLQTIKRCDTCHWWGTDWLDQTVCGFTDTIESDKAGDAGISISVSALDDSGLYGALVTGPAFSCMHWRQGDQ